MRQTEIIPSYHVGYPNVVGYSERNDDIPAKAIVLIVHGMAEHVERYNDMANYFSDNEWVASESINNGLWIFTSDKAIQYAEYYYGIDEDILCLIYETAYYDEFGEMYYVLRLKSKSLANFEGSEILLVARVYEDGKMLASGEKEELRVQKETVFNGDQSAEVKEVIEYYFGAEQLESLVSVDDFDSKLVYSVSLYSQIGDIMDTSYLAEQFSALGLEYDVEMYL